MTEYTDDLIEVEPLADAFKTLGHPIRLSIFLYLCNCDCEKVRVKTIYETLDLQQSIVSRHLGHLKKDGLITKSIEGRQTFYGLNEENKIVNCLKICFSTIADKN